MQPIDFLRLFKQGDHYEESSFAYCLTDRHPESVNVAPIAMQLIDEGEFTMGSPTNEANRRLTFFVNRH